MLPLPTQNAIAGFAGAALMLAIGVATSSATAVILGSTVLCVLATALALTMPIGGRMRTARLELTWWHGHTDALSTRGAVVTGVPFEIHATLRNPSLHELDLADLKPALASHVRCIRGAGARLVLPARSQTELALALVAPAPGRVVLHGLALTVSGPFDLFRAPLYFPSVLALRALPRAAIRTAPPARTRAAAAVERAAQSLRRMHGAGSDFRELRELLPGDPFKSIAWKASARTGRLMVREVDSEYQETFYVVLDVSGSMRGGTPGTRKLDHAIEVAALAARQALERGDRVGIITVDGRIVSHARPRDGVAHLPAVYDALLAATEVVDPDLTEPDDDELARIVARYIRQQDGLDFVRTSGVDVDALVRHVLTALALEREPRHHRAQATPQHATDRRSELLRRFCRVRGLALAHRTQTRAFAKGVGLARALREAAGKKRVPRSILLISDFDDLFERESLEKALRLLRTEQHALCCVFPDPRELAPEPDSQLVRDLEFVYGLGEAHRLRDVRGWLGKLGVPLLVTAGNDAAHVLRAPRDPIAPSSSTRRSA
jgi:uncharacterized protein (DUF58 family)